MGFRVKGSGRRPAPVWRPSLSGDPRAERPPPRESASEREREREKETGRRREGDLEEERERGQEGKRERGKKGERLKEGQRGGGVHLQESWSGPGGVGARALPGNRALGLEGCRAGTAATHR